MSKRTLSVLDGTTFAASRPQAWAAGAPLLLLTVLFDLRPGRTDVQADLPDTIGHVAIRRSVADTG